MNGVFCALLLAGVIYAAATGQADAAQRALLSGGSEAVELCLTLAGAYGFFGGVMGLLREGGVAAALAGWLKMPLSRLFRFEPGEEAAMEDICMNLSVSSRAFSFFLTFIHSMISSIYTPALLIKNQSSVSISISMVSTLTLVTIPIGNE